MDFAVSYKVCENNTCDDLSGEEVELVVEKSFLTRDSGGRVTRENVLMGKH